MKFLVIREPLPSGFFYWCCRDELALLNFLSYILEITLVPNWEQIGNKSHRKQPAPDIYTHIFTKAERGAANAVEKILDISETQAETMIDPDGMANDFDWEARTVVTRTTGFHALSLAPSSSS